MKCTPHNLEALLFFFFSKKGSNLNKFEKMKSIFIFSRKKRARRRKEKKRSGGRKRRKEETTRRLQERGSGDLVCQTSPKLSLSLSLSLARSSLPLEKKKKYWQRSNLGAVQSMVDYKSSPQVLEHLEKSLAWTVFDTKWIPGTSSFVAVGAYARGRVGSK